MDDKDAYIRMMEKQNEALLKQIDILQKQVANLTEAVLLMRKDKFGASSEKTKTTRDESQLSWFNEVELVADSRAEEPIERKKSGDYAHKATKSKREVILKDLPVREIVCDLPDEAKYCDICGTPLKVLGKEVVREELEYIPAELRVVRYIRYTYECMHCRKNHRRNIVKAFSPTSLINHSLASPSSVAYVIHQKYVNAIPLYRQEKEWEQMGIALSRATMANWLIRCTEEYLNPLVEQLQKELLQQDIIHCDETPVQVLKEDGKKPQTKSYMWLYCSAKGQEKPVILYDYQPSRNGDNAVKYLKDFHGYVHSDGYAGYNKLTGITRCGCWAHVRRKFVEAIPDKKAPGAPLTDGEIGRDYCDGLFHMEAELAEATPEARTKGRMEKEKPLLQEFWNWLDGLQVLKGSALSRAVQYAKKQKPYLENYLLDPRLEISNNVAENAIRPFTVGRKNWLFADTPKGAKTSATIYSLVETAKANGLNVFAYFEHVLMYMPDTDWRNHEDVLEYLMPWSPEIQAACKKK